MPLVITFEFPACISRRLFCVLFGHVAWQRVRTANQLANSGPEWYDFVSRHNSGTYNNQYMVIDSKLFKPGNALPPNTLFVVEQIPGLMAGADVTNELVRGYWPSYNGKVL